MPTPKTKRVFRQMFVKKLLSLICSLGLACTLSACSSTDIIEYLLDNEVLTEDGGYSDSNSDDVLYDDDVTEEPAVHTQGTTTYVSNDEVITYVYEGSPWVNVDDGLADFTAQELEEAATSYETYAQLDGLGRCVEAVASVGQDLMPTEKRGSISSVKPTGWQSTKYDSVQGKYLYNRCHLIGFQLTGENANKANLITGTRYLNIDGMLDFENSVAEYVKSTGNHVLYRVTPLFEGDELVARGVRMEGYSVEDNGEGVNFDIYAFNVQPGITIDYATGSSSN